VKNRCRVISWDEEKMEFFRNVYTKEDLGSILEANRKDTTDQTELENIEVN
jgi:hypothetical protein